VTRSLSTQLTTVKGLRVGHGTDETEGTGVTTVLFPAGASGAVEVRGGAPGTYHTASLGIHGSLGVLSALFFSGGSLYGLDAATGIRHLVLEEGGGRKLWGAHSPLVGISGAVIFDLPRDHEVRADYEELAYQAAKNSNRGPVKSGRIGAGRGALVGKLNGLAHCMNGGVGSAATKVPGTPHTLGALTVVNAVGSVVDPSTGKTVAGARSKSGHGWAPREEILKRWKSPKDLATARGTVLVLVATDAPVTRWELSRMSRAANDGAARSVIPAHMASDGDIAFAVGTNPEARTWPVGAEKPYPGALSDLMGLLVEEVVTQALLDAVRASNAQI